MQRIPHRLNPRRDMLRHILIKLAKVKYKEKILKARRENEQMTYSIQEIHDKVVS